jgi:hypothetical protein
MLKAIAIVTTAFFIFPVTSIAQEANDATPMNIGEIYKFVDATVTNSLIGENRYYIEGTYTTSKLGKIKFPYYRRGKYTIVNRYCKKPVQVVEKTPDSISLICPE